ncbi:MAG TPA: hypothetical protein VFY45_21005, partial [Baekduia sp.]|nr:hypothetical protein [Baekduia sp.]
NQVLMKGIDGEIDIPASTMLVTVPNTSTRSSKQVKWAICFRPPRLVACGGDGRAPAAGRALPASMA